MSEHGPLREPATSIGVANKLFQTAETLLRSPEASNVGIPRTVDGREFPMRVVSLVDDASDTTFHIRREEDVLNKKETLHITWFFGDKQSVTADGCIKLTRESDGRILWLPREYERVSGQDTWKFWNTRGPQTFINRLDDRTHADTLLTDEATEPILERLSRATIDKDRTWRESVIISVDNMTKVKGFKSNWRTHELLYRLLHYGVEDEAIQALKHSSALNVPRAMLDNFIENIEPRRILKRIVEMHPDLREKLIGRLVEPKVTTKLVQRFTAAYFKK